MRSPRELDATLPFSGVSMRAGPMDLDELREVVAKAARKGSVQAMKLALELVRLDSAELSIPTTRLPRSTSWPPRVETEPRAA